MAVERKAGWSLEGEKVKGEAESRGVNRSGGFPLFSPNFSREGKRKIQCLLPLPFSLSVTWSKKFNERCSTKNLVVKAFFLSTYVNLSRQKPLNTLTDKYNFYAISSFSSVKFY